MNEIELKLYREEIESILAVLNDLPTRTNAWPLVVKINHQLSSAISDATDNQENPE